MNCIRNFSCLRKKDNILGAENVVTNCDVNAVVTAAEDKDFIVFVDGVKEEAFGETCVDDWDGLLT